MKSLVPFSPFIAHVVVACALASDAQRISRPRRLVRRGRGQAKYLRTFRRSKRYAARTARPTTSKFPRKVQAGATSMLFMLRSTALSSPPGSFRSVSYSCFVLSVTSKSEWPYKSASKVETVRRNSEDLLSCTHDDRMVSVCLSRVTWTHLVRVIYNPRS